MTRYAGIVSGRKTSQRQKAHPDQRKNSAGGYSFTIDKWSRFERFLILGAEGGTYYAAERKLVTQNYESLKECLAENGPKTVQTIVDVSTGGRAPKNDPAIFALAVAAGDSNLETRKAALAAMPKVCRIGTHLFSFLTSVQEFRGWGRGLRRAVASWYLEKDAHRLGLQVAKYRQRDGWSHRDVLRKCGGEISASAEHQAILRWVVTGLDGMGARAVKRGDSVREYAALSTESLPKIILGYEKCKSATNAREAAQIVRDYRLTHEMVPSEFLKSKDVWDALLESMPVGALVRNLGRLTALGNLEAFSEGQKKAVALLTDPMAIKRSRLHPVSVLKAMKQYTSGQGGRGSLSWSPAAKISAALEDAFYLGFDAIEPTGKNVVVALDVSGSMDGGWGGVIKGLPNITAREAAAAMAMVTVRTEPSHEVQAFSHNLVPVDITAKDRLDTVVRKTQALRMGRTNCALPMIWATQGKIPVDAFYVYTDNETWFGDIHPHQALEQYRQKMGRDAKLVVVGMTATEFSIAKPEDPGMLDVVGFDTAAPAVMADFTREGYGR